MPDWAIFGSCVEEHQSIINRTKVTISVYIVMFKLKHMTYGMPIIWSSLISLIFYHLCEGVLKNADCICQRPWCTVTRFHRVCSLYSASWWSILVKICATNCAEAKILIVRHWRLYCISLLNVFGSQSQLKTSSWSFVSTPWLLKHFSSPEPKSHWWWPYSIGSTLFKHLLLRNHGENQSNFIWSCYGMGERNLFQRSWSHDQGGHHAHIW